MELRAYRNLVPDSPLHRHLEHLLRENLGRVSAAIVCEEVLQIRPPEPALAEALVAALIEGDFRLRLNGGGLIEWADAPAADAWNQCQRFAVIDVETTNGSREEQRIIEIGVCVVEDGKVASEWSSLVNPDRHIPYWVQQLTGINNDSIRTAPRFAELVPRLLDDLEDAFLVAHHARFDVACLNGELSRSLARRLGNRYLCTVELSRRLLPGSRNYRLETLSRWLGLRHERPHRAGSDARATAELFCHLLQTTEAPWSDYLRPRDPTAGSLAAESSAEKIVETNPAPLS
ncbi:MAG: 3'-5' exonuclease [Candidatus Acidiferrales bacterium]